MLMPETHGTMTGSDRDMPPSTGGQHWGAKSDYFRNQEHHAALRAIVLITSINENNNEITKTQKTHEDSCLHSFWIGGVLIKQNLISGLLDLFLCLITEYGCCLLSLAFLYIQSQ